MKILDACCGSKMFWFDKENPDVTFMDIRQENKIVYDKKIAVNPDVIGDFRNMPFADETFHLVVFDPPHLRWAGENSIMKAQYGELSPNWPDDIKKGFEECFRVLKVNGTLIFKWSDVQIPLNKVLPLSPVTPLFGQKRSKTHWLVFVKQVM